GNGNVMKPDSTKGIIIRIVILFLQSGMFFIQHCLDSRFLKRQGAYNGMTRERQSWQLIAESVNLGSQSWQSILAVNCGTVTFFPTHKLLGRKKVKIPQPFFSIVNLSVACKLPN